MSDSQQAKRESTSKRILKPSRSINGIAHSQFAEVLHFNCFYNFSCGEVSCQNAASGRTKRKRCSSLHRPLRLRTQAPPSIAEPRGSARLALPAVDARDCHPLPWTRIYNIHTMKINFWSCSCLWNAFLEMPTGVAKCRGGSLKAQDKHTYEQYTYTYKLNLGAHEERGLQLLVYLNVSADYSRTTCYEAA